MRLTPAQLTPQSFFGSESTGIHLVVGLVQEFEVGLKLLRAPGKPSRIDPGKLQKAQTIISTAVSIVGVHACERMMVVAFARTTPDQSRRRRPDVVSACTLRELAQVRRDVASSRHGATFAPAHINRDRDDLSSSHSCRLRCSHSPTDRSVESGSTTSNSLAAPVLECLRFDWVITTAQHTCVALGCLLPAYRFCKLTIVLVMLMVINN